MTDTKIKFGLVGAGAIARSYVQAFKNSNYGELVAIADVRPEAAAALAKEANCPSYNSHTEMLAATDLDAVVVCTPPSTHPEICLAIINLGINVLCEKPLSVDNLSAKKMLKASQQKGVILTMASKFRYVADVIKARELVNSGAIGEIVLFENAFTARVDMSSRWNSNPQISGGGVLIDNGTHSVDITRYFLGPLAEVQVVEGKRIQELPVEDTVRIFVKSTSGVMGNIDLSWSINKELDYFLRIYGSQGTISVGWKESKYRQSPQADWVVFGDGYNKIQAFSSQIDNFSQAILGQDQLLITAEDALASVEAVEAAYAALKQSRWTSIAPEVNKVA